MLAHTVLVVDDNIDELQIIRRVLSKAGDRIKMMAFSSAEAAIEALRKEKVIPSLVLLDLKLPGMSGIDALRVIRCDMRLKNIPVVICSNSTLESDMQRAMDAGADKFLHKAFDVGQFTKDINIILSRLLKD
jgi:CheY-like chemotaxis protein